MKDAFDSKIKKDVNECKWMSNASLLSLYCIHFLLLNIIKKLIDEKRGSECNI